MFQYQNLFRIITLPLTLSPSNHQNNERPILLKSTCNFRNTVYEKANQHGERQKANAELNKQKEKERSNEVFENNFKRKYYSVCSQMIKIKSQWKKQKENKEAEISIAGSKFYQRMGTTLLKGLEEPTKNKTQSKWNINPRHTHKGKTSLKLNIQQPAEKKPKHIILKHQNYSYKELMLQKQLTMKKRQSACKRTKIHSNCSIEQRNPNEVTELKGWNHLQEIIEDDLYESH